MQITLTCRQRHFARHVAGWRYRRGGAQQYGATRSPALDVGAAEAELAVAIALGRPWSGAFARGADVGDDLEVRWTIFPAGRLIVHPSDPDDHLGVLVIGRDGSYRIAGWLECALAKRRKFIAEPRKGGKAYFVPQVYLKPIEELVGG